MNQNIGNYVELEPLHNLKNPVLIVNSVYSIHSYRLGIETVFQLKKQQKKVFYIDLSKKKYKTKKCYTNNSHVHGNSPVNYLINELIIYKKIKLKLKIMIN